MTIETEAPVINETTQNRWARRVRAMLDQAENAGTPQESEVFTQRAMELMERYAIDEAMLGRTQARSEDKIETVTIDHTGVFRAAKGDITWAVLRNCNCLGVFTTSPQWARPQKYVVHVSGFTSDLERVQMLDASLQLQAATAMRAWEAEQGPVWETNPRFEKFKDRRTFLKAFASGVASKMQDALRDAKRQAADERVATSAAAGHDESTADVMAGVELALRDRQDRVRDWFDKRYGKGLRSVRDRSTSGSYTASSAGYAAGRSADTGQTRVGGGRRAIGN